MSWWSFLFWDSAISSSDSSSDEDDQPPRLIHRESSVYEEGKGIDVEKLSRLVSQGNVEIEELRGKDVALIIGRTGVGKSTFIQMINGLKVKRSGDGKYVPVKGMKLLPDFEIGHDSKSKTKCIRSYSSDTIESGLVYVDTPGFKDTDRCEIDVATTIWINKIAKVCKSMRFVLMIHGEALNIDKGGPFRDLMEMFSALLKNDMEKIALSTLVLFTHMSDGHHDELPENILLQKIGDKIASIEDNTKMQKINCKRAMATLCGYSGKRPENLVLPNNLQVFNPITSDIRDVMQLIETGLEGITEAYKFVQCPWVGEIGQAIRFAMDQLEDSVKESLSSSKDETKSLLLQRMRLFSFFVRVFKSSGCDQSYHLDCLQRHLSSGSTICLHCQQVFPINILKLHPTTSVFLQKQTTTVAAVSVNPITVLVLSTYDKMYNEIRKKYDDCKKTFLMNVDKTLMENIVPSSRDKKVHSKLSSLDIDIDEECTAIPTFVRVKGDTSSKLKGVNMRLDDQKAVLNSFSDATLESGSLLPMLELIQFNFKEAHELYEVLKSSSCDSSAVCGVCSIEDTSRPSLLPHSELNPLQKPLSDISEISNEFHGKLLMLKADILSKNDLNFEYIYLFAQLSKYEILSTMTDVLGYSTVTHFSTPDLVDQFFRLCQSIDLTSGSMTKYELLETLEIVIKKTFTGPFYTFHKRFLDIFRYKLGGKENFYFTRESLVELLKVMKNSFEKSRNELCVFIFEVSSDGLKEAIGNSIFEMITKASGIIRSDQVTAFHLEELEKYCKMLESFSQYESDVNMFSSPTGITSTLNVKDEEIAVLMDRSFSNIRDDIFDQNCKHKFDALTAKIQLFEVPRVRIFFPIAWDKLNKILTAVDRKIDEVLLELTPNIENAIRIRNQEQLKRLFEKLQISTSQLAYDSRGCKNLNILYSQTKTILQTIVGTLSKSIKLNFCYPTYSISDFDEIDDLSKQDLSVLDECIRYSKVLDDFGYFADSEIVRANLKLSFNSELLVHYEHILDIIEVKSAGAKNFELPLTTGAATSGGLGNLFNSIKGFFWFDSFTSSEKIQHLLNLVTFNFQRRCDVLLKELDDNVLEKKQDSIFREMLNMLHLATSHLEYHLVEKTCNLFAKLGDILVRISEDIINLCGSIHTLAIDKFPFDNLNQFISDHQAYSNFLEEYHKYNCITSNCFVAVNYLRRAKESVQNVLSKLIAKPFAAAQKKLELSEDLHLELLCDIFQFEDILNRHDSLYQLYLRDSGGKATFIKEMLKKQVSLQKSEIEILILEDIKLNQVEQKIDALSKYLPVDKWIKESVQKSQAKFVGLLLSRRSEVQKDIQDKVRDLDTVNFLEMKPQLDHYKATEKKVYADIMNLIKESIGIYVKALRSSISNGEYLSGGLKRLREFNRDLQDINLQDDINKIDELKNIYVQSKLKQLGSFNSRHFQTYIEILDELWIYTSYFGNWMHQNLQTPTDAVLSYFQWDGQKAPQANTFGSKFLSMLEDIIEERPLSSEDSMTVIELTAVLNQLRSLSVKSKEMSSINYNTWTQWISTKLNTIFDSIVKTATQEGTFMNAISILKYAEKCFDKKFLGHMERSTPITKAIAFNSSADISFEMKETQKQSSESNMTSGFGYSAIQRQSLTLDIGVLISNLEEKLREYNDQRLNSFDPKDKCWKVNCELNKLLSSNPRNFVGFVFGSWSSQPVEIENTVGKTGTGGKNKPNKQNKTNRRQSKAETKSESFGSNSKEPSPSKKIDYNMQVLHYQKAINDLFRDAEKAFTENNFDLAGRLYQSLTYAYLLLNTHLTVDLKKFYTDFFVPYFNGKLDKTQKSLEAKDLRNVLQHFVNFSQFRKYAHKMELVDEVALKKCFSFHSESARIISLIEKDFTEMIEKHNFENALIILDKVFGVHQYIGSEDIQQYFADNIKTSLVTWTWTTFHFSQYKQLTNATDYSLEELARVCARFPDLDRIKGIAQGLHSRIIRRTTDHVESHNFQELKDFWEKLRFFHLLADLAGGLELVDGTRKSVRDLINGGLHSLKLSILDNWNEKDWAKLNISINILSEALSTLTKNRSDLVDSFNLREIIMELENYLYQMGTQAIGIASNPVGDINENIRDLSLKLADMGLIYDQVQVINTIAKAQLQRVLNHVREQRGLNFIFKLGIMLEDGTVFKHGDSADEAARAGKRIVGDFYHFKDVATMEWNKKVAQQGVEESLKQMTCYEYNSDSKSNEVRNIDNAKLKLMFDCYEKEYKCLVHKYLKKGEDERIIVKDVLSKADSMKPCTVQSWNDANKDAIPSILAGIFAFYTVSKCKESFNSIAEGEDHENLQNILLTPHNIQVITILCLLGCGDNVPSLQNQLMQIGTGEGKSIILGALSTVFGILGFRVTCVCYSEYLSTRDYNDFADIFKEFGCDEKRIVYCKITEYSERTVARTGNVRMLTEDLIFGRLGNNHIEQKVEFEPQNTGAEEILLVDEVDVFFGKDFYGKTYNQITSLSSPEIVSLIRLIWQTRASRPNLRSISDSQEYRTLVSKFEDFKFLLDNELKLMCSQVNLYNQPPYEYDATLDRIGYTDHDTVSYSLSYGYRTVFAYLYEYEKGSVRSNVNDFDKHLTLEISCGQFSYANINPACTLGVSGTLQALTEYEREVMVRFNINKYSISPSVYGDRSDRFVFDQADRGIVIVQSVPDYFRNIANIINEICRTSDRSKKKNRAIIVFFENVERLVEFNNSEYFRQIVEYTSVNKLTENTPKSERDYIVKKASSAGQVTISTKIFGRGTDFVCRDSVLNERGGVHIVQTFLSEMLSEEIQLKGRTSRQGQKGSFSMILLEKDDLIGSKKDKVPKADTLQHFNVTNDELSQVGRSERYAFLNQKRDERRNEESKAIESQLEIANDRDQMTNSYFEALLKSNRNSSYTQFKELYTSFKVNQGGQFMGLHVVFCLDESGSMYGGPFDELKRAYKSFVSGMKEKEINNRLSVVMFASSARKICESVPFSSAPELTFSSGGTSFAPAINMASTFLQNARDLDLAPVVILMTDGGSSTKAEDLDAVVDLNDQFEDLQLHLIAFGDGADLKFLNVMMDKVKNGEVHRAQIGELQSKFKDIEEQLLIAEYR